MPQPLTFIVDDDQVFSTVFHKLLTKYNYKNISMFNSGEECIKKLKSNNKNPSIVFLDFSLNGLNGLDVLKQILMIDKRIKVVIVTYIEDELVREKCLGNGAFAYISKKEIQEKVPTLFKNKWERFFSVLS